MSEEQPVQEDRYDPLLEVFAKLAQDSPEFTMPVTVTVSGAVVTGTLIGRDRWSLEFAEATQTADDTVSVLASAVQSAFVASDLAGSADEHATYDYLHMRAARYVTGSSLTPSGPDGVLWRGRLRDVRGWSLGSFGDVVVDPGALA